MSTPTPLQVRAEPEIARLITSLECLVVGVPSFFVFVPALQFGTYVVGQMLFSIDPSVYRYQ